MQTLLSAFKAARKVSTPLLAISTPDPAATIEAILSGFEDNPPAILQWDVVRGMAGLNAAGVRTLASFGSDIAAVTQNPVEALAVAVRLPDRAVLFLHNAHRYVDQPAFSQACWNLRDIFKSNKRTLVLLCPGMTLPSELSQDVLTMQEALPGPTEIEAILRAQYACAQEAVTLPELLEETIAKAVDATIGLAAFPAEQAIAMSITPSGLDLPGLWERKRQMIEQTPGLSVWRGGETFADIGGVQNAKTFLTRLVQGKEPPRAVVFIDEIEKALAGASSDSSGVSQSFLGTLLSFMQDTAAQGILFLGPPGAAKSAIAKAVGNTAGIPTISFDLGGMKSSLVGESEARLRSALSIVQAVSQNRVLFVATCNSLQALAPEIRRRFKEATMFFDLPDAEERKIIWEIYLNRYDLLEQYGNPRFGLPSERFPDDIGWTGAEIRQCCDLAYKLDCSLKEAAEYIVPISRSAADQIETLRTQASGRFISASHSGLYDKDHLKAKIGGRAFTHE